MPCKPPLGGQLGMWCWDRGRWLCVLFSLCLLALVSCDDFTGGCNSEPCWELYQTANSYYQADVPGIESQAARKCTVLRTYRSCLVQLDSVLCAGTLSYRGAMRVLRSEFNVNNCSADGPVYPEGPEPVKTDTATPCSFKKKSLYSYCTLFGDPHLITFSGQQMTCKLEGAWPLIDNEFLTVQVTNSPQSASSRAATVTQKVTVVIKGRGGGKLGNFCGSKEAVFYSAEAGSLPSTFADGMREYGAYNSIQVKTAQPGEQVEIYIKYIDSTVVIRQIASRYLSVGIRIPELVLNGTREGGDFLRQLCLDSCPVSERVDLSKLLLDISQGTPRQRSSYAAAQASCRDKAVTDFFFDSCVFDVLMTGESSFVSMAHSAYDDVRKFSSRQPRWTNRTDIVSYTEPSVAARSRTDRSGVTSSAAYSNTSLVRTLLFVYVMYVSYH